jgi:hypothetical protein
MPAVEKVSTGCESTIHRPPQEAIGSDRGLLLLLAFALVLLHTLVNGQYGFHRDELMELDDARRLAWGYVSYPPLTPFLGRVELAMFGTSLLGPQGLETAIRGRQRQRRPARQRRQAAEDAGLP